MHCSSSSRRHRTISVCLRSPFKLLLMYQLHLLLVVCFITFTVPIWLVLVSFKNSSNQPSVGIEPSSLWCVYFFKFLFHFFCFTASFGIVGEVTGNFRPVTLYQDFFVLLITFFSLRNITMCTSCLSYIFDNMFRFVRMFVRVQLMSYVCL